MYIFVNICIYVCVYIYVFVDILLLNFKYTYTYGLCRGFPGSSGGKESTCNAGDLGSIPELGRSPGGGHGNPLQYSFLENPHGQRSLVSYSLWGHKELDMTEGLSIAYNMTSRAFSINQHYSAKVHSFCCM